MNGNSSTHGNNSFANSNRFDKDVNNVLSAAQDMNNIENNKNNENNSSDVSNIDNSRFITYSQKTTPIHYSPANKLYKNKQHGVNMKESGYHLHHRKYIRSDNNNNIMSNNSSSSIVKNVSFSQRSHHSGSMDDHVASVGSDDDDDDDYYDYSSNDGNDREGEHYINFNNSSFTSTNATFVIPRRNILGTTSYLTTPALTANMEHETETLELPEIEALPCANRRTHAFNDLEMHSDTMSCSGASSNKHCI